MTMLFSIAVGTLAVCLIVLVLVLAAKRELHARHASWWILFAVVTCFSDHVFQLAQRTDTYAIYILYFPLTLLVLRSLYFDIKFSKQMVAYRRLAQSYALLEERVQEFEQVVVEPANCKLSQPNQVESLYRD